MPPLAILVKHIQIPIIVCLTLGPKQRISIIVTTIILKEEGPGMKRQLSGWEHWLQFWRTQFLFLPPT